MKINIISVGKIKEKYFADALSEYKKRLSAFCEICVAEVAECAKNTPEEIKSAEGFLILERLSKMKGETFALDRGGEAVDSEDFSKLIGGAKTRRGAANFIIGGSYGLSAEVLKKADRVISFGTPTFPHQLFRVILAEQIYRGFMIESGRSYHK
ncbi:MAG: 23S rRNA (pseudouridine(1915)-N(3))-methyltransferase RlmH [Clostridiales bacterium]|jgi:23S rRNA (pseudouridine1915-N3)-methyltransferase|nr:23S rRNA (pseudouridine(1915)-N(3))-methyltransferase RlmH [Clostridiales bacterium]